MALDLDLPTTRSVEKPYREIENVLTQVRAQVEARYNQKIAVLLLTVTEADAQNRPTLHRYTVKLSFVYRNYTESIMELDCTVGEGYPVAVRSFNQQVGTARSKAELEELVARVFADPRTRNTILINY
jgi:hypothetical protein